jgi:hypothetical protein
MHWEIGTRPKMMDLFCCVVHSLNVVTFYPAQCAVCSTLSAAVGIQTIHQIHSMFLRAAREDNPCRNGVKKV